MKTDHSRPAMAALSTLVILQLVMLGALFAGVSPHPPEATPLFGIGPFIGVSLAACVSAMVLHPTGSRAGAVLALLSAVMAAVSFGPQKYLDPQIGLIWPAVVAAQVAIVSLVIVVFRQLRGRYTT